LRDMRIAIEGGEILSHWRKALNRHSDPPFDCNRASRTWFVGLVLQPTRRHGHRAVAGENGIDFGHIGVADLPAERAEVFNYFSSCAEADQRLANNRIAQSPA